MIVVLERRGQVGERVASILSKLAERNRALHADELLLVFESASSSLDDVGGVGTNFGQDAKGGLAK